MIKLHMNGVEQKLKWHKFSDGALNVSLDGQRPILTDFAFITAIADGNPHDNFFCIKLVLNLVRHFNPRIKTTLYMPYVPYARADRHFIKNDAAGLETYANGLNNMGFDKVLVVDPHSDVAPALINNCHIISQDDVIGTSPVISWFSTKNYLLVAPDAGSLKKIGKVAARLGKEVVTLGKDRDVKTGAITNTRILDASVSVSGRDCIIVDDICDGGGTFIAAAETLYAAGAASVELFVTHGIFSRGLRPLQDAGFTRIITTDSITNKQQGCDVADFSEFVRIITVDEIYKARNFAGGYR